jgi:hypothetical protein
MPTANKHTPATVRPIAHTKEPPINSNDQVRIVVNQPKYAHHTITTKETAAKLTTQLRKKTKASNIKLICSYRLRQLYESVWDLSIKCKRYPFYVAYSFQLASIVSSLLAAPIYLSSMALDSHPPARSMYFSGMPAFTCSQAQDLRKI